MHKHTFARFLVGLSTILSTLVLARSASADTINVTWDPNPEPQVIGYVVHVGTQSGSYSQHIDVGPTTSWSYTSAVAGQQYCFTVTAYVAGPLQGPGSTEVCGFGNAPPVLVNPGTQGSIVGQPANLQLAGSDPKGDPLTYSATGLPPGLTLMASTGYVSGTPTTTGTYAVTARVSDGVLTASQTFSWTVSVVDTIAPVVTITGPTSAATYSTSSATLSLSGSASDAVGVTQVSWVSSRGGSGNATGMAAWTIAGVPLQAGANVLTITARDAAGNTASDALTVTVNGAPTLASVSNQSSALGLATTLQLVGSDPNGDALTYSATGLPTGVSLNTSSGLIAGTPTAAGSHAVTASVSDGTLSASRSFTWSVGAGDAIAPVVTISTTTAPTIYWSSWGFTLAGSASDNIGVTQVTWANSRGGSGSASGTATWSTGQINLQTGANVITVSARDAAGNVGTAVLTVHYGTNDTTAPVVTVTSPTSAATCTATAGSVVVGGTASDAAGVTQVSWANSRGGSGVAAGTTNWSATVPLQGGSNVVTVTARDSAGNTSTDVLTVTYNVTDTIAPTVTITSPTTVTSFSTTTASLALAGTAGDNVGLTQVSWTNNRGGSGTATGTTNWNAMVALQSGVNVLTVTARDAAGNIATDALTVTLNVAPTLASVANQSTAQGLAASLQLNGADANGDALTYGANGLPPGLALAVSTGLIAGIPTTAGSYPVTVTVSDAAQTATRTFTWTVAAEVVAPVVTMTSPTTAATFAASAATLTVAGTASDNVGVTQVSWVNNRGGSGIATGTTNWNASIALQSGSNVVTVTARDAAGNTSTDVLTVTYTAADTTAPVLSITSPTTAATLTTTDSTLILRGTATDNVGVTQVNWANNRGWDGTASGTTSWSTSNVHLWTGINVVTVTARDAAGNVATRVLTVTKQ